MHLHAFTLLWNPNYPPLPPKKRKTLRKKKHMLFLHVPTYVYPFPCLFLLSPQAPQHPFQPALLFFVRFFHPRQVVITLTSLRTDESEYHIISIYEDMILMFYETEIDRRNLSLAGVCWCLLVLLLKSYVLNCFEAFCIRLWFKWLVRAEEESCLFVAQANRHGRSFQIWPHIHVPCTSSYHSDW